MNTQRLFDIGLVINALGLVIVVILDIVFDLSEGLFDILSILFIAGGVVCVYYHNRYKRTEQSEEDSI